MHRKLIHIKVHVPVFLINKDNWAPSSEFVSSSIPSWQISTSHAQPFRGARDLAFCLKVPLDSLLVWASSEGSGETVRMRRSAWTFAARIDDKYQIRLTRSNWRHYFLYRTESVKTLHKSIVWLCFCKGFNEWATAWQNQQIDMCAMKAQISQGIHPFWSVFAIRMKKP